MKKLGVVFNFELNSYIKNKAFVIATLLISALLFIFTFVPRFTDLDALKKLFMGEDDVYGLVDENGYISDMSILDVLMPGYKIEKFESKDDLKLAIQDKESKVVGGFNIVDDLNFEYCMDNKKMTDMSSITFMSVMELIHKQVYCENNNIDYEQFIAGYEAPINCEEIILGKDESMNFWYCYILVIIIFMMIVLYGSMIATSVTTEKSNRAIEVLVTSIDSKYLLFGKVFAGSVSVIVQTGLIIGSALIGYSINHEVWNGKLDMILNIPLEVIINFIIFGLGGFVFFSFLYGMLGALVSKTEDVAKIITPVQMVLMISYMIVLMNLTNTDSVLLKVCSFLPISSYAAMVARVGMGHVEIWEIVISAVILFVSTIGVGYIAAKIYRMGTLRYGNPISITSAIKDLINSSNNERKQENV